MSLEEKEEETCQLFDKRQRSCRREMEGLKQRGSTQLHQASQMAANTQQALQLQVSQLQVGPSPPSICSFIDTFPQERNQWPCGGGGAESWPRAAENKDSMFAQAEKEKLQDEVSKLSQEKGLVELRLRSYETEQSQLAPTLEEAQWEVRQI